MVKRYENGNMFIRDFGEKFYTQLSEKLIVEIRKTDNYKNPTSNRMVSIIKLDFTSQKSKFSIVVDFEVDDLLTKEKKLRIQQIFTTDEELPDEIIDYVNEKIEFCKKYGVELDTLWGKGVEKESRT